MSTNQPGLRGIHRPNERVVGVRLDELLESAEINAIVQREVEYLQKLPSVTFRRVVRDGKPLPSSGRG